MIIFMYKENIIFINILDGKIVCRFIKITISYFRIFDSSFEYIS